MSCQTSAVSAQMVAIGSCRLASKPASKAAYIYGDVFPFDGIVLITDRIKPRQVGLLRLPSASCLRRLDSTLDQFIRRFPPVGRSWMMRSRRVTRSNRAESSPISGESKLMAGRCRVRHRRNAPDAVFYFAVHRGGSKIALRLPKSLSWAVQPHVVPSSKSHVKAKAPSGADNKPIATSK